MENVITLEEMEKRIIFLYKMLEKQSSINQKLIDGLRQSQEAIYKYSIATNNNTMAINVIAERFLKED